MGTKHLSLISRRCRVYGSTPQWRAVRIDVLDGHIDAIHDLDAAPPLEPPAEVLDLGERLLVPAFVNAHTHLAMHGLRGAKQPADLRGNMVEDVFFRWESKLGADDVRAFARVAAIECALHGVGTVFDHYYFADAVAGALRDVGLAGVVAPTLQDLAGPGNARAEDALRTTIDLLDREWADAGIVPAVGPHATDTVSAELWHRAVDLAAEHGLALHAHVAQSAEEAQRAFDRHGVSPVAWLQREGLLDAPIPQLLVHALYLDGDDLLRLDPTRHALGSCPFSQVQFGYPAPVEWWQDAGVPWFVGTDCGPSNDSMNVQKELRLLAGQASYGVRFGDALARLRSRMDRASVGAVDRMRQQSLDDNADMRRPETLLASVWERPGSWHPMLRTGAIEVGRRADFAVYEPQHPAMWPGRDPLTALAYTDTSPGLWGLMVGGRWIGEAGDVHAILRRDDTREWIEEASRRAAALHASM